MSTPSPKFATKYKFGTKRKRKTPYNFQKCAAVPPPVPDHAENGVLPESSGADAGVLGLRELRRKSKRSVVFFPK
ncbi:hypothetical protein MRX96_029644 [Rhipicephalus microplus]